MTDTSHTRAPGTQPEETLGMLIANASRDLSALVHSEIALAKAEITADAKQAGKGAGMFAGAGVMGFLGVVLLLFAVVYGLVAAGLSVWLSFLIVAVVLFVVAGILALVGKKAVSKVKGKPERAIVTTQETIAAIKPNH